MAVFKEDTSKLPQWAQRRIASLESNVSHWKAKAETGPEGSDTFVHSYNDDATNGGQPLGRGVNIRFEIPGTSGDFILARLDRGSLLLHASSRSGDKLIVRPQSSNVIRVEVQ